MEGSTWGGQALSAAVWNQRQDGHTLGAGPTIHSTVKTSRSEIDIAFVQAARAGDVQEVRRLLDRVSSIDVLARPIQGTKVKGRPATALHMAASVGSEPIVKMLIEAGADVSYKMQWLRSLTPLHMAATPEVARLLLDAGAQPIALDPREPHPFWYHNVHGRRDVAAAIDEWRRAHLPPTQASMDPLPPRATPSRTMTARKTTIPALSAAEIGCVASLWTLDAVGVAALEKSLVGHKVDDDDSITKETAQEEDEPRPADDGSARSDEGASEAACVTASAAPSDCECSVCMGDLLPTNLGMAKSSAAAVALVCLPCGQHGARAHAFHSKCLQRWLLRKAICPICRADVRPLLRKAIAATPGVSIESLASSPSARNNRITTAAAGLLVPRPSLTTRTMTRREDFLHRTTAAVASPRTRRPKTSAHQGRTMLYMDRGQVEFFSSPRAG